jgi:hypothetical protein
VIAIYPIGERERERESGGDEGRDELGSLHELIMEVAFILSGRSSHKSKLCLVP